MESSRVDRLLPWFSNCASF